MHLCTRQKIGTCYRVSPVTCGHIRSTLTPGGGYVLVPANHRQVDAPPEDVVVLYRFGRRYGRYPLIEA
jgi:hypothetical protein